MKNLREKIEALRKEITGFESKDPAQVEEFRIKYLGTKGQLKNLMGELKNVPVEQKKEAGQVLNEFKQFVEAH